MSGILFFIFASCHPLNTWILTLFQLKPCHGETNQWVNKLNFLIMIWGLGRLVQLKVTCTVGFSRVQGKCWYTRLGADSDTSLYRGRGILTDKEIEYFQFTRRVYLQRTTYTGRWILCHRKSKMCSVLCWTSALINCQVYSTTPFTISWALLKES